MHNNRTHIEPLVCNTILLYTYFQAIVQWRTTPEVLHISKYGMQSK